MPTPESSSRRAVTVPTPEFPTGGRAVEAHSAEFTWSPVDDVTGYRLQIAPEADFETTYFDAVVEDHTTLTVVDALPADAATCYWRVRAEAPPEAATAWSGVAHFATTPDALDTSDAPSSGASTEEAATPTSDAPSPQMPTGGAPTDGRAAEFVWDAAPGATAYELQVARDADFDDPGLTVPVGDTTTLTLYDMLPEDGSTFFWRVRAALPNGDASAWSPAARFAAATDEDVIAHQAEQERDAALARERDVAGSFASEAERAEAESPVLTARTSGAFTVALALFMVFSFVITLALIYQAV